MGYFKSIQVMKERKANIIPKDSLDSFQSVLNECNGTADLFDCVVFEDGISQPGGIVRLALRRHFLAQRAVFDKLTEREWRQMVGSTYSLWEKSE
jgi:hypothetical protein